MTQWINGENAIYACLFYSKKTICTTHFHFSNLSLKIPSWEMLSWKIKGFEKYIYNICLISFYLVNIICHHFFFNVSSHI